MTNVLIVDDEPQILRALQINLNARGYQTLPAADGASALDQAAKHAVDVVILDLGLPDMDGIDVIRGLRGWTDVPIIILSARHASDEKVDALDAGADDYVTKPFDLNELLARVRAATRRVGGAPESPTVETADFEISLIDKRVTRNGEAVRLTPIEWNILELLARNPGKLISQQQVLTHVWGPAYTKETQYLRVYIAQLRRKLEPDPAKPRYLLTEAGMGYRFEPGTI
ncbi:response regulator [Arthrobacter crystallopoietes]|uniref:Transcriptional regulatory protein KdpE n=1 Tax=Crystallibacter crystallopoietes TaxID=37928 RepID=A0A1H0ZUG1_9MICC|nr:response regulator [Arthrobacter crystallopoietes]AUI51809.1 DNA-binding response regulator [Arthrobacter crystallopoietes]SDQ31053.1 two-component system, OmpR family, KDP operon response regulator KdpE [Arthrobacter crystallopoietes]